MEVFLFRDILAKDVDKLQGLGIENKLTWWRFIIYWKLITRGSSPDSQQILQAFLLRNEPFAQIINEPSIRD